MVLFSGFARKDHLTRASEASNRLCVIRDKPYATMYDKEGSMKVF
ncbi:MAG: hypothetical protein U5L45_12075 [Saprospiraceae bacterium]|nr:hypothetical protein [Saprospiraceae bacterium]